MNSKQRLRTRLAGIGALLGAGAIAAALYSTDVIHGKEYAAKAEAQYGKPAVELFDRGAIYFSGKDGTKTAAAALGTGYLIYMNPKLVRDAAGTYEALSHYLSLDRSSFLAKAGKPNDSYEELAHRVDQPTADSITGLGLPGVAVAPEAWRIYPGDGLAAHELGLVGEDVSSSTVSGRYGLERYYDSVLSRPSASSVGNIFADLFSGLQGAVFGSAENGDIVTTIEPTVETYLDKILGETEATWHADEIGGIVMDPETGEIAAMASLPTFDPNNTAAAKDIKVFSDPLVEHVYEMGSIMKPLTMAAALDSGAETPASTYDDVGCMTLDGKKICNFDGRARGVIPMQQILSQSLNIGAATIALKTGAAGFAKYFYSFGLGMKTGIDLPSEAAPITDNLKDGKDIDIATASYGQGLAVSPIGMTRALSVVANGGYLVTPHLVKEIDYSDGSTRKISSTKAGPLLEPQTADEVRSMLVTVVDTALAGGTLKRDHYTVAAKTGTAEIADPVHGGYYTDRYLHSFFGFFPAYEPRFIVFLYQVYPKGAQYASETLTRPFDELTTFLLNYYDIPPDR
ncbi:MAG: penicillin-binding protein 2 [Minisyncoccia bacterium]|jgi:cell division protein FtsI/penicillin-binding protein 2